MAENTNLAYISQITLPSGNTYHIKDAELREEFALLSNELTGALVFVGVTETAIKDGDETAKIQVNGAEHTAETGDVVISGKKEFVFTSAGKWAELGDFSDLQAMLGRLAYVDSASGQYTPAGDVALTPEDYTVTSTGKATINGSISQPVFEGEENQTVSVSGSVQVVDAITAGFTGTEGDVSVSGDVTAAGTVSKPEFRGAGATINSEGLYTPEGTITAAAQTEDVTLTSVGSIEQITSVESTFTGTQGDVSVSGICTPLGTVSAPEITVTATTASDIAWTGSVANETLTFSATTITYVNGVEAALAEAPVFTGQNTSIAASGKFTPAGTIANTYGAATANISVTGTVQKVTGIGATFAGKEKSVSVAATYTPTGEVTQPTFEGSAVSFNAGGKFTPAGTVAPSFTTKAQNITSTGVFTAKGTVSTPTFTGSEATLSVTGVVPTAKAATFTGTAATITVSAAQ